ncbi:MAG: TonB-dependent receptor, partial [Pyrinomonadaceae bacterium]
AAIGQSFNKNKTVEINNFTNTSFGNRSQHTVKFGGKFRYVTITDRSENNYGGTYLFPGFFGTDACDINGDSVVSPLEQYRCKVTGVIGSRYNPTQFTIATGNPELGVSKVDGALYIADDWKVSPSLVLSFGLRYENQSNISSNFNFAPRFGVAWSPGSGGAKAPKTVFRGGAGIFFERFGENNTLQAIRNNGINQLSLLVSANDPDPVRRAAAINLLSQPVFALGGVSNSLTAAQILAVLPVSSSTIRTVADDLQSPYTMQAAFSMERTLSSKMTLATTFITSRTLHSIRTRNVNAPVCPLQVNCFGSLRPDPTRGNINAYESSGVTNSNRIMANLRTNFNQKFSLTTSYSLGFSNGDTDTPAYSYDLTGEYGRNRGDVRHSLSFFGNVSLPWNVSVSPIITARSGSPFNITRGIDSNGDGFFNERPTFGQLQTRCNELRLTSSFCKIGSSDLNSVIPSNYGEGPGSFTVNMRINKSFGFGRSATPRVASTGGGGDGGGGGRQMVMMGGGGGGGG